MGHRCLRTGEGMGSVRNHLTPGLPQLSVELDVAEAARLGASAQDVAVAVSALNGQLVMRRYTADNGDRYDVVTCPEFSAHG